MNTTYINATEYNEININDTSYPDKLKRLEDAPETIWVRGRLPHLEVPTVAIIGARMCSEYGRYMAKCISRTFSEKGIQIINGISLGIEGIAMRSAANPSGCFAVLGSGANVCYPPENTDIYVKMGGVISEQELSTNPSRESCIKRERMVAALADAIVVVEARRKSGTLKIVEIAKELNIPIYALPGRVTDRLSDGCNNLIKSGAELIFNVEETANEICINPFNGKSRKPI